MTGNHDLAAWLLAADVPNPVGCLRECMKSWRKWPLQPFGDRPRGLLGGHWFSISGVLDVLCHVIGLDVESHMLPQL
jgi:hypothetical protein